MISTTERYDREDLYWLLTAIHASSLYEKFTRSSDLIDLLGSISSCEDLLLGRSEFFLQIFETFSEVEDVLDEMKR